MNKLEQVILALYPLIEPKLKWQIGELNLIKEVTFDGNEVTIRIDLITDDETQKAEFTKEVEKALAHLEFSDITLHIYKVQVALNGLEGVKKIIMVGSGKGGVGKSTVAANLAATFKLKGFEVGMMDADIYGPSLPILLGCTDKPQVLANEMLLPVHAHGMKFISTGSLVPPDMALAWRGQLVAGTLLQFIRNTAWGQLDYLIIDMPPGSGEVQLTLAAELKVDGVVVVSMPQEVVIGDVRRSLTLFKEKQIPVLGVIQNMASYICNGCGKPQELFPAGTTELVGFETLASLPLDPNVTRSGNSGIPAVLQEGDSDFKRLFGEIVDELVKGN